MKSIWKTSGDAPTFPSLQGDTTTDVLIIGGGIVGILTAHFLRERGVSYLLVEKGRICSGTTGNTTAKITAQHGLCYHKLLRQSGVGIAKAYLQANRAAAEQFALLCREIDCDFAHKDNFVYATTDRKKLEDEMEALTKLGYEAKFCSEMPLPLQTVGAVCFPNQAQLHPLKFLYAIAKKLNICENTHVGEMIGTTALTNHGRIQAKRVIVATHFPFLNKHGSYFLKLYQHRSYVLALEHAANVEGMYVDEAKTGLSFRNHKQFLLLGGGGHRTGKEGGNWRELRDFAAEHYPASQEKFFWAAQDCMSLDDMPYVGRYSKNTPALYTATGFGKWGMTGAMLAAMLLSDLVTDRSNDYAEVFRPSRSILRPRLLVNGGEAVMNLLTPTVKRCPHLGCALKWNPVEHSWDCPCHGSRFAEDGTLLDNPANGKLTTKTSREV